MVNIVLEYQSIGVGGQMTWEEGWARRMKIKLVAEGSWRSMASAVAQQQALVFPQTGYHSVRVRILVSQSDSPSRRGTRRRDRVGRRPARKKHQQTTAQGLPEASVTTRQRQKVQGQTEKRSF